MKLTILRGPSGSGKSTIASFLQDRDDAPYHEADAFFDRSWFVGNTSPHPSYRFDPSKLSQAHAWCRLGVEKHLFEGVSTVIVSNTNMTLWEISPYIELADKYNYEVEIWRTPRPWDPDVLFQRNVHGVPLDVLKKQVAKYKSIPGEQAWTDLSVFDNE